MRSLCTDADTPNSWTQPRLSRRDCYLRVSLHSLTCSCSCFPGPCRFSFSSYFFRKKSVPVGSSVFFFPAWPVLRLSPTLQRDCLSLVLELFFASLTYLYSDRSLEYRSPLRLRVSSSLSHLVRHDFSPVRFPGFSVCISFLTLFFPRRLWRLVTFIFTFFGFVSSFRHRGLACIRSEVTRGFLSRRRIM